MFKKFYEEGNEVEYETENPVKVSEIPDLISQVINIEAEVIDVYFEEVEVEGKDTYPTVVVDEYLPNSNPAYLIYSKELDEMKWEEVKGKIKEIVASKGYNVCDEDVFYISFCK